MTKYVDVQNDQRYKKYLDRGFIGLIDVMGTDLDIIKAARTSYAQNNAERGVKENKALLRYMFRNAHTSPFEMVELKFHLKIPIFVMRQHVRHRMASLNEFSGRYSEFENEFYIPNKDRMCFQSSSNKQMSGEQMEYNLSEEMQYLLDEVNNVAYTNYKKCLDHGLSRELARIQLPVSTYTELYWKIDLKNWLHYIKLRVDKDHAQNEIVQLAQLMYDLVKPMFPWTCEAFEDYTMNSITFSAMEIELMREVLKGSIDDNFFHPKMSKREIEEFKNKLKILT